MLYFNENEEIFFPEHIYKYMVGSFTFPFLKFRFDNYLVENMNLYNVDTSTFNENDDKIKNQFFKHFNYFLNDIFNIYSPQYSDDDLPWAIIYLFQFMTNNIFNIEKKNVNEDYHLDSIHYNITINSKHTKLYERIDYLTNEIETIQCTSENISKFYFFMLQLSFIQERLLKTLNFLFCDINDLKQFDKDKLPELKSDFKFPSNFETLDNSKKFYILNYFSNCSSFINSTLSRNYNNYIHYFLETSFSSYHFVIFENDSLFFHDFPKSDYQLHSFITTENFILNNVLVKEFNKTLLPDDDLRFLKTYTQTDFLSIIYLELMHMISSDIKFKKCKYCGDFFLPKNLNAQFCDKVQKDNLTCKTLGKMERQASKLENDVYKKTLVNARKALQRRISRNPDNFPPNHYEEWKSQANIIYKYATSNNLELEYFSSILARLPMEKKLDETSSIDDLAF